MHRRLLNDDALGVEEALNEMEFGQGVVARGQHFLTFGSSCSDVERKNKYQNLILSVLTQKNIECKLTDSSANLQVLLRPHKGIWHREKFSHP